MKYASKTLVALALFSGALAACASGGETGLFDGGAGGAALTTSGIVTTGNGGSGGTATTTTPTGGTECVPACSTDDDCMNSCPATPSGSNCCDTATGVCYIANEATCPSTGTGGFGGGTNTGT